MKKKKNLLVKFISFFALSIHSKYDFRNVEKDSIMTTVGVFLGCK